jgi:hypothetical protein
MHAHAQGTNCAFKSGGKPELANFLEKIAAGIYVFLHSLLGHFLWGAEQSGDNALIDTNRTANTTHCRASTIFL